jgi:acyl carrier protein
MSLDKLELRAGENMTDQEILAVFTRVLRDLLSDETIVLTMGTERQDVPKWDSFNYVNFIAAVEMALGIRFKLADIEAFENVGQIVAAARPLCGRMHR